MMRPAQAQKKDFSVQLPKVLLLASSFLLIPLLVLLIPNTIIKKDLQAADPAVKTGYYIGNGRELSITGLGSKPDLVIIKSDTANTAAVFKTSGMPTNNMAYFSATVDNRDLRLRLDSDGFTVTENDQFRLDTERKPSQIPRWSYWNSTNLLYYKMGDDNSEQT